MAGLGRVAPMRQLDAEPARGAEDGLALADVDLAVIDGEGRGLAGTVRAHARTCAAVIVLVPLSCRPGDPRLRGDRRRGPIATGLSIVHGIWVPAFAGTTP